MKVNLARDPPQEGPMPFLLRPHNRLLDRAMARAIGRNRASAALILAADADALARMVM
jgi:hypothetical protein